MIVSRRKTTLVKTALRAASLSATFFAFALVVWGGIVRINEAGMTCPDWPRCRGAWVPSLHGPVIYEWSHRFGAGILTALMLSTVTLAWANRRQLPGAMRAGWYALAFLCAQIVVGALTIKYLNNPPSVAAHLAVGFGTFVSLLLVTLNAFGWASSATSPREQARRLSLLPARMALFSTIAAVAAVVAGGYMSASRAGAACIGIPLCRGWKGSLTTLQQIHMGHRLLAYLTVALVCATFALFVTGSAKPRAATAVAWSAFALMILQGTLGILTVTSGLQPVLRSWHQANGALLVAALVCLTYISYRYAAGRGVGTQPEISTASRRAETASGGGLRIVRNYIGLTKLNVMSLLLFTTFAAMMIAAHGLPSVRLVLWTLLGGALASASSGAINMFLDRDIDAEMKRTKKRPIPSGRVAPRAALTFGVALGIAAVSVLAAQVNVLAALLAAIGILYYVFVYTIWLKRSTPQNIVIGGAAGAIPPLVGWAAVTDHVGLTAVLLFIIVFLWTPPHFWALALLGKDEYRRVGIPMLPVVRGDAVTKRHIVWYSAALLATTLVLVPMHLMGLVYLACALALDAAFLVCALWVARTGSVLSERVMYRYSMLYLALLFGAMVVDRFHHGFGV
ncbi:MAG: protoheme IX farnesyltransferase [Candidatus Eremiobacteraeota bacterium]|nr:protoheme IX farnesyltransferase [Candidatus Eremiobacteraeota bacterium]MBC5826686.1 protoheme IX farnesyltransferase [Candidatus Eremiobacteraeota bacterium]